METPEIAFLPGVPAEHVLARLAKAGGNEVDSGNLRSPQSSAALAVNTFGWFVEHPGLLPPFPCLRGVAWPPTSVEVEYCTRFPWRGGRHPWLDAVVETGGHLIGIESKRYEPYRDGKKGAFSQAYDRRVWGDAMGPFELMRDRLRSGEDRFVHLDAVQLVKHAFGLVTDGGRKGKKPVLLYLFAEPRELAGKPIDAAAFRRHRAEIARFSAAVAGSAVAFAAISYREWLGTWPVAEPAVSAHAAEILARFKI